MLKPFLLAGLLAGLSASPLALADRAADASHYYENALTRYEKHDDAGAIIQLKNALKEEPRMLPALVLMGQAYGRRGEYTAAERVFADAERLGAARASIVTYQARAYYEQAKYQALLEKFGAEGLPPAPRLEVMLLRAQAQMALSQFDAAMRTAQQAEPIAGGAARALALQSRIHLNAGRPADARASAARALQLAPRDADAWNMQASVAHMNGNLNQAVLDYTRALSFQPDHLDARLARAGVLLDLKRDAEARVDLDYLHKQFAFDPRGAYLRALYYGRRGDQARGREALVEVTRTLSQLPPGFVASREQLQLLGGLAYYALNEFEQAKGYLTQYLHKRPRETGARKVLGAIYLAEKQYDRAIATLEPALKSQPDDAETLSMLGSAQMGKGNHVKASSLFQDAAQAKDSLNVQLGLGLSLIGRGQQDAGFAALQRAYQKGPGQGQTGAPLAIAHLKRNEPKQAVAVMEAVLKREPANLSARNLLGVAKLAANDRAGARAAYETVIKADPAFHAAQLNLARLDEAEGQTARARQRYLGVLKADTRHVSAMLELARLEESAGRPTEAIRWLDKAHSLQAHDLRPLLALSSLYLRQGNAQQALNAAKNAQAIAPDQANTLMTLAMAQIAIGNVELARVSLRRIGQLATFDPVWLSRVVEQQMRIGDTESARYSLSKVLLADPRYLPALELQVRIDLQTGKPADAEKRIAELMARPDARIKAHSLLGDLRMQQKRYVDARQAFEVAHASQNNSDSLFSLYRALLASSQANEAAALMVSWGKRHPRDQAAQHALGEAYLVLKDWPRARAVFSELVRTNPNDARAHNNLANVLLQQRDLTAALSHAERARSLAPNVPQVNDTLGWALVQQGQTEKGLRYLREAALRTPDDPEIQSHLNATLRKLGKR
ncbi:MAG: PEP-CTERM system TPR-repeat protein PrsT [Thiobacillus sp.]|nr:PEP-CTERM system TPR-repeat protein PrsT [Thiobacillus sp.]